MQTAIAPRGDARTFLTHFVGGGLDDERYVIQRFVSRANGDIVPVHAEEPGRKGRRRARGTIVPLKAVEKMRPARDEIIIATGVTGLERDEVDLYLSHRLRLAGCELPLFEPPAVEALFQGTRGLPRQINRIAHYALSAAALDNARTVNAGHLQNALDELRP